MVLYYLGTNLVPALAHLEVDDFPHSGCESSTTTCRPVTCAAEELTTTLMEKCKTMRIYNVGSFPE